ncbi:hypothetical protein DdX_18978 [Ditylenchus destructor]|uniref:Uncharacterized protein n=1 Tax=Ditylenchus destructor TaxID=166010 RepID=A0AAD4MJA8_9BILA|nr:hypothetical protein DdX_18978 [Ditylenchus destructor]
MASRQCTLLVLLALVALSSFLHPSGVEAQLYGYPYGWMYPYSSYMYPSYDYSALTYGGYYYNPYSYMLYGKRSAGFGNDYAAGHVANAPQEVQFNPQNNPNV